MRMIRMLFCLLFVRKCEALCPLCLSSYFLISPPPEFNVYVTPIGSCHLQIRLPACQTFKKIFSN